MDGMSRAEIDRVESKDFAIGKGPLRPRDAATLILLDTSAEGVKVLLGRRHHGHAFMPGKFVFPGGRTDPADSRVPAPSELHPSEVEKLTGSLRPVSRVRARAIAMSAIRETYEEAGLLIGTRGAFSTRAAGWQAFVEHGVQPALDRLRLVARAITPPGRVRRFDTRFLAAWRHDVALALPGGGPTNELEELVWLPIGEAKEADIPTITRTVLGEVEKRLQRDPTLGPGGEIPFYRMLRNRFRRELL
jgi:8-oxo-dGTP pyrophosphatase MutT (NUDIX family)